MWYIRYIYILLYISSLYSNYNHLMVIKNCLRDIKGILTTTTSKNGSWNINYCVVPLWWLAEYPWRPHFHCPRLVNSGCPDSTAIPGYACLICLSIYIPLWIKWNCKEDLFIYQSIHTSQLMLSFQVGLRLEFNELIHPPTARRQQLQRAQLYM